MAPAKGHDARTRSVFAHGKFALFRFCIALFRGAQKRSPEGGGTQYEAEFGRLWPFRPERHGTTARLPSTVARMPLAKSKGHRPKATPLCAYFCLCLSYLVRLSALAIGKLFERSRRITGLVWVSRFFAHLGPTLQSQQGQLLALAYYRPSKMHAEPNRA
jgi:hypothetical protein